MTTSKAAPAYSRDHVEVETAHQGIGLGTAGLWWGFVARLGSVAGFLLHRASARLRQGVTVLRHARPGARQ
ncbi:MAG TPA: hypothetical protein PLS53_13330 [Thermoanaerobaculaceae bacterium]|nr:hypothetical protein [Thermoanaerobaculaceae bacterium]